VRRDERRQTQEPPLAKRAILQALYIGNKFHKEKEKRGLYTPLKEKEIPKRGSFIQ